MDTETSNMGLNDNHVRHVLVTFRYMDGLLSNAEHILVSAGTPSPFQEYADDTTPIQRKVTHDYIARIREAMRCVLEELRIPRPAPVSGALWAARNAVTFADIALAEMESKRMVGYGRLSDDAARRIDGIVAELRAAVGKLGDYLAQGAGADLQARLQRLEKTSNEVPLLRELERIITAHGLVEFRNAVVMLLERLENGTFEIGVFGRVSSGKSSLLNHLLGGEYLPVGVTPVTAVPTRITHGSRPQIIVEFAEARPQTVELSALAEFATEQQNPGNTKHVTRIRVQVPAARLREGITFVDTPGLGSLALAGAAETVAYLPRCDLGIVLVDAASTLTKEDLQVIHAIYVAGATATVLVSKADLLKPADRERSVDYVRKQIRAEVNVEPSVHLVSVMEADGRLCDEWFESQLRPMLDAHRELTAVSLKRKIGGLREALLATLKKRGEGEAARPAEINPARLHEIGQTLRAGAQILEAAQREVDDLARKVRELEDEFIEAAADEIAGLWLRHDSAAGSPAEAFAAAGTRLLGKESMKLQQLVEHVRTQLAETLQSAAQVFPSARSALHELPNFGGLPLPDPSVVAQKPTLRRPAVLALFGRATLRRHLRTKLREQVGSELQDFLGLYSRRLVEWAKETLSAIEAAFSASAEIIRAQLERRPPATSLESQDESERFRRDITILQTWEKQAAAPEPVLAR